MPRRANAEQADAFVQLRAWAGPLRLRVVPDMEGFPIVPGRHGRIEWTGGPLLAVYSDHPRVFSKLLAVVGVKGYQVGDIEIRLLFPPEVLANVASLIHAHRKPGLSSAEARRVGLKTAFKGPSGGKEPSRGGRTGVGAVPLHGSR